MELKQGYKQTEVGVIPIDWDLIMIGECLEFKNGLNKEKEYFGQGTPIVNYMDVYKYAGIRAKDLTGLVTLSNAEIKNYEVKKGDVFFTRTSETVDEIGVSTVALDEMVDTVFSGFVLRGRPKNDKIYLEFKKYCFTAAIVRKQIISTASYTTRALTNGHVLSNVLLPLPTKAEQTAIATALSNIDELISQTEKLIDKKKAIKQGFMQELFKPKEGWVTKKLGDVCDLKNGYAFKSETYDINGELSIITISNVQDGFLDLVDFVKISEPPIDLKEHHRLNIGDILISMTGNVGRICKVTIGNGLLNQRVGKLLPISIHPDFLFFYLLNGNFKKTMILNAVGGAQGNIGKGVILDFVIHCPLNVSDQENISKIVGDIYSEIETLESKLQKLKYQKQGMMQTLLTGKIRLL